MKNIKWMFLSTILMGCSTPEVLTIEQVQSLDNSFPLSRQYYCKAEYVATMSLKSEVSKVPVYSEALLKYQEKNPSLDVKLKPTEFKVTYGQDKMTIHHAMAVARESYGDDVLVENFEFDLFSENGNQYIKSMTFDVIKCK